MKKVAVIMGSPSDMGKMQGAAEQLKEFGIPHTCLLYTSPSPRD